MASSQRDQQKEVVRLLTLQHGYKIASEMSGVPYDLCRQWGVRGKWKEKAVSQSVTSPVKVAADNVASELEQNGKETKLSLSRYARRAAKDSEQLSTREAPLVHKVAQVAGIVHGWNEQKESGKFTLNVLNMGALEITARAPDSAE